MEGSDVFPGISDVFLYSLITSIAMFFGGLMVVLEKNPSKKVLTMLTRAR